MPDVELIDLGSVRQRSGKLVHAFAGAADLDPATVTLGTFELEWPRGSGRLQLFPELAEVAWMPIAAARARLVSAQVEFLDRLVAATAADS